MPVVPLLGQTPRVNPFRLSASSIPVDDPSPAPPPPSSASSSSVPSPSPLYTWSSSSSAAASLPSSSSSSQSGRRSASGFDSLHQFSRKKAKHAPSSTPIQSSSAVTAYSNPSLVGTRPHRRRYPPAFDPPTSATKRDGTPPDNILDTPLSPGQQSVLDAVLSRRSVFFTGCAGTGKSFLLNYLKKKLPVHSTFFTASTGLAAVNVQGSTIHSFAGIGLGVESKEKLCEQIFNRVLPKKRWRSCQVLVIDEISMIDCNLFDKLEYIARKLKNSDRPFGGIQLILTGDFLQLPPVRSMGFCFESVRWNECVEEVIELESVFRQEDSALVSVLNHARRGVVDAQALRAFQSCVNRQFDVSDGIVATRLYPTRKQVGDENVERLNQLPAEPFTFTAVDHGTDAYIDTLRKGCNACDVLTLKVGAQVMLIKNLNTARGLVNGSRGVVEDFVRSPDEGHGLDIPVEWTRVYPTNRWPQVRFVNGERVVCTPETWSVEVGTKPMATRLQVPLMLAWSLTMHKCQGMTLDRVSLHLGGVFEQGQAYVALSRIRSLDSLSIQDRFDPRAIIANPKALHFYDDLAKKRRAQLADPVVAKVRAEAEADWAMKKEKATAKQAVTRGLSLSDDDYDEQLMAAMVDEDSRREEAGELESEMERVEGVVSAVDAQVDFVLASQLNAERTSKTPPPLPSALIGFSSSQPAGLLAPRSAAVDAAQRRASKQPYQGEREEIDLLSDDDSSPQRRRGETAAANPERMDTDLGLSLPPQPQQLITSIVVMQESSLTFSSASTAGGSTELISPSQPGSAPASQPKSLPTHNPFSVPRTLPPHSSSSVTPPSSLPSPAASSSSSLLFSSAPSGLTRSTRLTKPLHPLHASTAARSPLLRATCRAHGEALSTQEKREGEEEHLQQQQQQQRKEGEVMVTDERKEGEKGENEAHGVPSTWIYRCARGCRLSIST